MPSKSSGSKTPSKKGAVKGKKAAAKKAGRKAAAKPAAKKIPKKVAAGKSAKKAPKKAAAKKVSTKAPKKAAAKKVSKKAPKKSAARPSARKAVPKAKAPDKRLAWRKEPKEGTGAKPTEPKKGDGGFEPRIVAFACNWCSYPAADAAGISKMQYPPYARIIRVMCAGRIHPAFVLRALELGADGVLVSGCHFEDCHYLFGARRSAEQFEKAAELVRLLGIEPERVRYEQISAAEAPKFVRVMQEFAEDIKKVGPSPLAGATTRRLTIPGAVGEETT